MIIFKFLQNRRLRRSQASLDKNLAPEAPNSPRYCCEVHGSRQHESDVVVSSCSESKIPRRPPTAIMGFGRSQPANRGRRAAHVLKFLPRPGTQVLARAGPFFLAFDPSSRYGNISRRSSLCTGAPVSTEARGRSSGSWQPLAFASAKGRIALRFWPGCVGKCPRG